MELVKLAILLVSILQGTNAMGDAPDLRELARVAYRSHSWDALFGLTDYARRFRAEDANLDEIRLIETLALVRHCRWEEAIRSLSEIRKPDARAKRVATLLAAVSHHAAEMQPRWNREPTSRFQDRIRLWKMKPAQAQSLDPRRLRKHIAPLCEGKERTP